MAHVAMIVGPEFEDSELRVPLERLRAAGHEVTMLGERAGEQVEGKRGEEHVEIEAAAADRSPESFDALVIPGGHSPDHLRMNEGVVSFVRRFVESGKPIAAVCHGPQLLIEADAVSGKKLTSWPSVRTDLENAGAEWVDAPVVRDGPLISSRGPQDLEPFSKALVETLA